MLISGVNESAVDSPDFVAALTELGGKLEFLTNYKNFSAVREAVTIIDRLKLRV
jgi:hypothetical protein